MAKAEQDPKETRRRHEGESNKSASRPEAESNPSRTIISLYNLKLTFKTTSGEPDTGHQFDKIGNRTNAVRNRMPPVDYFSQYTDFQELYAHQLYILI
ncbi:hypothetical protein ATK78_1596 [Pedobacter metabolipauper]|uniref:Uncharacterized protein n=1 Tax=Pedobacter metabolipauper TaxID=425513 RepID=A0A4R6SXL4_9SPHI|nr:hypothetical protein ATK78_1596 [Pedobacter metabolipauper]